MSTENAELFLAALNRACGEVDEAAKLSKTIFADEEEIREVRRELGRLMTQIDLRIIPVLRKHYPNISGYLPLPE